MHITFQLVIIDLWLLLPILPTIVAQKEDSDDALFGRCCSLALVGGQFGEASLCCKVSNIGKDCRILTYMPRLNPVEPAVCLTVINGELLENTRQAGGENIVDQICAIRKKIGDTLSECLDFIESLEKNIPMIWKGLNETSNGNLANLINEKRTTTSTTTTSTTPPTTTTTLPAFFDPCAEQPCRNEGRCIPLAPADPAYPLKCVCKTGFGGDRCDKPLAAIDVKIRVTQLRGSQVQFDEALHDKSSEQYIMMEKKVCNEVTNSWKYYSECQVLQFEEGSIIADIKHEIDKNSVSDKEDIIVQYNTTISTQPNPFDVLNVSDYNECLEKSLCSQYATCTNTIGSYECLCLDGYEDVPGSDKSGLACRCARGRCNHRGECRLVIGSESECQCVYGYSGARCEEMWLMMVTLTSAGCVLVIIVVTALLFQCICRRKTIAPTTTAQSRSQSAAATTSPPPLSQRGETPSTMCPPRSRSTNMVRERSQTRLNELQRFDRVSRVSHRTLSPTNRCAQPPPPLSNVQGESVTATVGDDLSRQGRHKRRMPSPPRLRTINETTPPRAVGQRSPSFVPKFVASATLETSAKPTPKRRGPAFGFETESLNMSSNSNHTQTAHFNSLESQRRTADSCEPTGLSDISSLRNSESASQVAKRSPVRRHRSPPLQRSPSAPHRSLYGGASRAYGGGGGGHSSRGTPALEQPDRTYYEA